MSGLLYLLVIQGREAAWVSQPIVMAGLVPAIRANTPSGGKPRSAAGSEVLLHQATRPRGMAGTRPAMTQEHGDSSSRLEPVLESITFYALGLIQPERIVI